MKDTELLSSYIREACAELDDAHVIEISISDLAEVVYRKPPLVQLAGIMQLRQLARGSCWRRHRSSDAPGPAGRRRRDFEGSHRA